MKIKDLLNVEKAIKAKNMELAEQKQELEMLRQEAEELKLIVDFNNRQYSEEELINITDVYYVKVKDTGVVYFARKMKCEILDYKFVDIFTNETLIVFSNSRLSDMELGYRFETYSCTAIDVVFPELRIFLDKKAPKLLLQKLYYRANGIDARVLKLGAMQDKNTKKF